MSIRSLVLAVLMTSVASARFVSAAERQVRTESGLIEGVTDTTSGVTAFKGIPFAALPTGDRRWRPPAPAAKWESVRKADRYGAPCVQAVIGGLPGASDVEFNELLRLPGPPAQPDRPPAG